MLGSTLFYVGAVAAFVGLLSLIRPLRWLGIRTRRRGTLVAAAGAALALSAILLPDSTRTTTARDTLIDQWLPEWQFGEYHERRVRASPRQVFAAIRRVRSSDIFLFRTLTFIRNPGRQRSGRAHSQPASRKAHPGRRAVQWIRAAGRGR